MPMPLPHAGPASPAPAELGRGEPPYLPLFDVARLHSLVGDNPAVIAQVLEAFRESAAEARAGLRRGAAAGSVQRMADAAHGLRPGANSIGALSVAEACAAVERAAQAVLPETPPTSEALLVQFEGSLDAFLHLIATD